MNLLTDPFIPVLSQAGSREVSLVEVICQAHEIEDLDWGDPLVAAPLLGVITAFVADALQVQDVGTLGRLLERGRFDPEAIKAYAAEHAERFELFGQTPFMQVEGLRPQTGGPKSAGLLQLNVASGNNVPLFAPASESRVAPMAPAAAARALLAVLGYDVAGIKGAAAGDPQAAAGKTTGNHTGPLGGLGLVVILGRTLFHTIAVNVPALRAVHGDAPTWRLPPLTAQWTIRQPRGPLELQTWAARRIRLFHNDDGLVNGVVVAAGDRMPFIPEFEMRTGWRRTTSTRRTGATEGISEARPRQHQSGRAAWRGLPAILQATEGASDTSTPPGVIAQLAELTNLGYLDEREPIAVQLVGVEYGTHLAVIENVIADRTPLPLRALRGAQGEGIRRVITEMSGRADDVAKALNQLGDNLRRASGGENLPWDKGQRLGELFLGQLAALAGRLLHGLTAEPDKVEPAHDAWDAVLRRHALALADPLLDNVPPRAFLGHEAAAANRTDKTIPMRAQLAEAYFRASLAKILPPLEAPTEPTPMFIPPEGA